MSPEDINNFDAWNEVKKKLDHNAMRLIFYEREVWWYATCNLNGKAQCALLSQVGSFSVQRLYSKIGRIKAKEFLGILDSLEKLIFKK